MSESWIYAKQITEHNNNSDVSNLLQWSCCRHTLLSMHYISIVTRWRHMNHRSDYVTKVILTHAVSGNGHIFRHKAGSVITWTTSFSVLIKYLTCTTSSNHQLITLLLQSLDQGRTEFEKQKQYCFKIVRLIKLFNEITRSNEIKDLALVVDIMTRTATCPVKITHYSNSKVEVELCRSQNTKEHVSVIGYHWYLLAV